MIKRILLGLFLSTCYGAPLEDLVKELDQMPDLSFGLYSGYIPVPDTQRTLHYVAALSQNNPFTDPVIFWFNGGPGCSSLLGFTQENGPYIVSDEPGAKFQKNEHSWNKNATVVYLEFPGGVGFSLCENGTGPCSSNDNQTAEDNMQAILLFFETKFPELQNNELYIAGESYAGIYIPYLMHILDQYIQNASSGQFVPNLKGMLIGNGVTSFKYDCIPAFLDMALYHNLLDDDLHQKLKDSCTWQDFMVKATLEDKQCDLYFDQWMDQIDKLNIYDIYGKCYQGRPYPTLYQSQKQHSQISDSQQPKKRGYTDWLTQNLGLGKYGKGLPQCDQGRGVEIYMNTQKVRQQLHIPDSVGPWEMCSSHLTYKQDFIGTVWAYKELRHKYRILKFSGDRDGAVPTLGTRRWIAEELGWDIVEKWRPYYYEGQIAGYVEERDGLTFASIHDAGHMTPVLKPAETHYLIFNWLFNKPL